MVLHGVVGEDAPPPLRKLFHELDECIPRRVPARASIGKRELARENVGVRAPRGEEAVGDDEADDDAAWFCKVGMRKMDGRRLILETEGEGLSVGGDEDDANVDEEDSAEAETTDKSFP